MNTTDHKVNVPVLWDSNGNFRNNEVYSVSVDSIVNGTFPKPPSNTTIPGYEGPTEIDTLLIVDPTLGGLYLTITLAEFQTLIGNIVF